MPKYKLKIMVNISDPIITDFQVLTSSMLEYTGKSKLDNYPYIDPDVEFVPELRDKIQNMSYNEKLETFFIGRNFDSTIIRSSVKKEKNKEGEGKEIKSFINENFEFTIQTILCTGFPVANYYQTMEFYDKTISNKKITLKGSKGAWDFILPSKFSRCFSYIKLKNKLYTSTGVIWLNDALNHPVYKEVIKSYKKYKKETENIRDSKTVIDNTTSLNDDLNKLYINMYFNKDVWKDDSLEKDNERSYKSNDTRDSLIFRENVKTIINGIRVSTILELTEQESEEIIQIFNEYSEIKKEFEKDQNKDRSYRIYEVLLNHKDTFKENNDALPMDKILAFGSEKIQKSKNTLKELIKTTKPQIMSSISSQIKYKNFLNSSKLREKLYKDEIYNIIENNEDYRDREKEEVEKIDSLLKSEFPNYSEYSKGMKKLETERKVSNPFWKEELEKYSGKRKVLKKDKDRIHTNEEESFFDVLLKCDNLNSLCKHRPEALQYLNTGIDEIRETEKGSTTKIFEAYVQVNVAEGKITEKNYDKLICPYMDEVLGDYVEKDDDVKGENYILKNSVFINLKDKIEQIKKEEKEEKIKSAKKLKKNNSVKKLKGGKRKSKTKRNYS